MNTLDHTQCWREAALKVTNHARAYRLPDLGGVALLEVLHDCWWSCLEEALETGKWEFLPFTANFEYRDKLQTMSSLLDRLLIQLVLAEPGWRMQRELINGCCDDELMPLPPAFRFRPPLARHVYSNWLADYRLWQDAQRLFAKRGYTWVVKCDIRDCFYCIDRNEALNLMQQYIDDSAHRKLLNRRFASRIEAHGGRHRQLGGLPVEEPCSHLLANAFLSQLDKWVVKDLAVPHVRFVDDMRFFCKSEDEGRRILRTIREGVQVRYGLRLNETKSAVEKLQRATLDTDAAKLLRAIKNSIAEPLEDHFRVYELTLPDAILDAWNSVQHAIVTGVHTDDLCKDLDILASLRPYQQSERSAFVQIMRSILSRACEADVHNATLQRNLIGIAMRQLRYVSGHTQDKHFVGYLSHSDPSISGMAFSNLVRCRTPFAKKAAEDNILSLLQSGNVALARLRFRMYVQTVGHASARLRAAFVFDEDDILAFLANSPHQSAGHSITELSKGLASSSPFIRRNTALQIVATPTDESQVTSALSKAIRAEKHRDARIAMLIAAKACTESFSTVQFGSAGLPRSKLEMVVLMNWKRQSVIPEPYPFMQSECDPEELPDKDLNSYTS